MEIKTKFNTLDKVFFLEDNRITEGIIKNIKIQILTATAKLQSMCRIMYDISYVDGEETSVMKDECEIFSEITELTEHLVANSHILDPEFVEYANKTFKLNSNGIPTNPPNQTSQKTC